MRKLLLTASAIALLGAASSAFAGDINITPQQISHPYPTITAGTILTGVNAGSTIGQSAAIGNLTTANSNGGITVNPVSSYGVNQYSDTTGTEAITAALSASHDVLAGANLTSVANSNEMDLTAAGYVTATPSQINTGLEAASTSLNHVRLTDTSSVGSAAAGNVLTATGYGVTLLNNGDFAAQSQDSTQTAATSINHVLVSGGGSFSGDAQAVGNDAEFTGFQGGVNLDAVQTNGTGFGSGQNGITGYAGATETASLSVANTHVLSGTAAFSSLATGNNLSADASYGGSITSVSFQNNTNFASTAATVVSGSTFAASLNAGATAIGNAASFKTH